MAKLIKESFHLKSLLDMRKTRFFYLRVGDFQIGGLADKIGGVTGAEHSKVVVTR